MLKLITAFVLAIRITINCGNAADENPALADLAECKNWNSLRQLIESGSGIDTTGQRDGMTALHWAVHHDHTEMTRLLIQRGAVVTVPNEFGVTPLALACINGNPEIVELLLDAGAEVNRTRPGGETPLMTAARTGNADSVERLLQAGAEVDTTEWSGQTALMWASSAGHEDVVQLLLNAGADRSVTLKSGFNALMFAVRDGQKACVLKLLDAGDDVNSVMLPSRPGGKNPREGTSPLILAVENGHFELGVELLKRGADPNDQRSGYSALHTLTWVRKPDRGDDPTGDPAPRGSGNVGSLQFAEWLVQHGADVNLQLTGGRAGRGRLNEKGATPFFMASDTADIGLMKCLLKLGADPTLPNADHCSPLLAAAGLGTLAPGEVAGTEEESLAAVELLLRLGAEINSVDDNGETVIHGAAYASFPQMVDYLVAHGADAAIWNRPNKYKWTPLAIAQGHRPGNFKPDPATIQSIQRALGK
ncbi:MAG: ankyrin repeat domain-containing protein [Planctomycetaceae bacterium]